MSDNFPAGRSVLEEIKESVQENSKSLQEMQKQLKFIHNYIFWQKIWGTAKILFFVVMIILGTIYLPPLIQGAIAPYKEIFQEFGGKQKTLFDDLQKLPGAGMIFGEQNNAK